MEIFLGSHHFLLIMKHTPPPLFFPASAVLSIQNRKVIRRRDSGVQDRRREPCFGQTKDVTVSTRLAVNRGSRFDFTPRPTLFFLPAGFCCLVSSIEETPSARLSKLENYGFDQLVSQRD